MENDKEKTSFISICTGEVLIVGIILGQIIFSYLEKSEIFLPIVINFLINFSFQKRRQKTLLMLNNES